MYGLLLENVRFLIVEKYGESTWNAAREMAGVTQHTFVIHNVYSETLIIRIVNACSQIVGATSDEIMYEVGLRFVSFVGQYGYGRILKVLGRNMRDFLNGLDNLHEYLRFSYPKLSPPSFFVSLETRNGMILHYRSKRKGFLYYVLGQIKEVGRLFYNADVGLEILESEDLGERGCSFLIGINFDNKEFVSESSQPKPTEVLAIESKEEIIDSEDNDWRESISTFSGIEENLCLPSDVFFDIFPFHILLDENLNILSLGSGLKNVILDMIGKPLVDVFDITRPILNFTWENVLLHTNVVFELLSKTEVHRQDIFEKGRTDRKEKIHLKGQMMHMSSWKALIFLGTPILESLETMFNIGLFINDLSMHDSSRDLVLAGMQQSAELRLALDQEKQKSSMLEESMRRLDVEMSRTDALLYRMIPKQVADRLRKGEPALSTCETFENVTILFSDVVGFTSICSKILPMEVVKMLNEMYTKFDYICEIHEVYKVETIGDAYMVVSGVPEPTVKHAQNVADMALAMVDVVPSIPNPLLEKQHLKIRIGIHSGMVVAGVVGIKMPRYCLFGDTVNTASRMESGGQAMSVHISESTKQALPGELYKVKRRGTIPVKGKGTMQTYWLTGKVGGRKPISPRHFPTVKQQSTSSVMKNSKEPLSHALKENGSQNKKDLVNGSMDDVPQCPFAAIFKEAYEKDTAFNMNHLLDIPPSIETTPMEKRKNNRSKSKGISSLGVDAQEDPKVKWSSVQQPLWVERNDNTIHSDLRKGLEDVLKTRPEESKLESEPHHRYLNGYSDQSGPQKENFSSENVIAKRTGGASMLQLFCLRRQSRNEVQDNINVANKNVNDTGIAVIGREPLNITNKKRVKESPSSHDNRTVLTRKQLPSSSKVPNNSLQASSFRTEQYKNSNLKSPKKNYTEKAVKPMSMKNARTDVPKRNDGRCVLI